MVRLGRPLADLVPQLLEIKAKSEIPIRFYVQIEVGDGVTPPPEQVVKEVSALLSALPEGFGLGA